MLFGGGWLVFGGGWLLFGGGWWPLGGGGWSLGGGGAAVAVADLVELLGGGCTGPAVDAELRGGGGCMEFVPAGGGEVLLTSTRKFLVPLAVLVGVPPGQVTNSHDTATVPVLPLGKFRSPLSPCVRMLVTMKMSPFPCRRFRHTGHHCACKVIIIS